MRIHVIQHVSFEGPAYLAVWAERQGHSLAFTRWYQGDSLPAIHAFDALVVLGGPMGVYDEAQYPWLITEKVFLREAIDAGKKILGICLGAQLLADVLGGQVLAGKCREIGWFRVYPQGEGTVQALFASSTTAFHWHGDVFTCPPNAQLFLRSSNSAKCICTCRTCR